MTPNHKLTNVIKGRIIEDLQMTPAEISMRFSDGSTMHVKVIHRARLLADHWLRVSSVLPYGPALSGESASSEIIK
jgi:hypothetical protein